MRLVLITQDDPFYLPSALTYLFDQLHPSDELIGCVLLEVNPTGDGKNIWLRALSTYQTFGVRFFLHYFSRYVWAKLRNKSVRSLLQSQGVNIISLSNSINHEESLDLIRKQNPDILVSIAGNQIFKNKLINVAPKGCINLHTGDLPKYRGLMPTFWALHNDEKQIGITVFQVDEGIDSGPIITQRRTPIQFQSQQELIIETKMIGMECIIEALNLIRNDMVQYAENKDEDATYFSYPTKKDILRFKANGKTFF